MNVYSQTFDLWDLTFDEAEGTGELTWLSNGLNWDFELEYLSAEGCQTLDTLSFRTIFRPECLSMRQVWCVRGMHPNSLRLCSQGRQATSMP